jgi:hypothetical protein
MKQAMAEYLKRAAGLHAKIGADLASHGGILRCETCTATRPLGDVGAKLRSGWPMCCGLTMRWVTQRELDAEAQR